MNKKLMGIFNFNKRNTEESQQSKVGYFLTKDAEDLLVSGYTRLADNPEVQTAVNQIADLVSNMTIQLMQNSEKGDVRVKNDLSKLVDIKPNGYQSRKNFVFWIVKTLLIGDGNAVVLPISRNGKVVELRPLASSKVRFIYDVNQDFNYVIDYEGRQYQPSDVLHFAINPDENRPFLGTGYRVSLSDVTHNLKQASKTKRSFMSSNYKPSLAIYVDSDSDLDEESRQKLEDKYMKRSNPNAPLMLPDGMLRLEQIKPLTLTDLALNDAVKIDKQTVATILGIPPFVLGVGTYTKDEWNNFINTKIMSIAQVIQQTLNNLIVEDDMYFNFNARSLYNYSLTDLVNSGTALVKVNAMRRNELRNWLSLPPDDEMDDLLVLENFIQQADVSKQKKLVQDENEDLKGGE
ncbi:phage portal protein [Bavariicoccus seileri]|nr:phage portal protein [Bavariicoccus seileri]